MTRTELLSLAERLTMYGFGDDCQTDVNEAAAILRKLADLRPVAWRITDGEGDYLCVTDAPDESSVNWSARWNRKHQPLHQLSEVLTDD